MGSLENPNHEHQHAGETDKLDARLLGSSRSSTDDD
jgi:hypothetical protein